MKKKCLVHIMNPVGFIAALSAIETLNSSNNISVYIIVEWPGSDRVGNEIFKIIKLFSKNFPIIKKTILKNKGSLGGNVFDEIYFSHDLNPGTVQTLFDKYPKAKKICYGDSFGLVFTKQSFFQLLEVGSSEPGLLEMIKQKFSTLFEYLLLKNKEKTYQIHQSVLILPVDQSGEFFKNVPLIVCPKKTVLDVINKCAKSCAGLKFYIKQILKQSKRKKIFLFLTENFAEGNLIEADREVAMYVFLIKKYCRPSDIVYLKSHPGEVHRQNPQIIKGLPKYQIFEIDKSYNRFPIEIWHDLLKKASIISVAYPVLSLKYLYNIDVIQPMDNTLIKNWFPKKSQNYLKNAIQLYMQPLKKLKNWDQKSPLYIHSES